jgi:hypothetical protein
MTKRELLLLDGVSIRAVAREKELVSKLSDLRAANEELRRERDDARAVNRQTILDAVDGAIDKHAKDYQLKEPNRLIKQDERIAALELSLGVAKQALEKIRDMASKSTDLLTCAKAPWDLAVYQESRRALAALPAATGLAEAVREVVEAEEPWDPSLMEKLKAAWKGKA